MLEKLLYTRKEAAQLLSFSPKHIDTLIARGDLEVVREKRAIRITARSLVAYAERVVDQAPKARSKPRKQLQSVKKPEGPTLESLLLNGRISTL
ncbi:MAG: helix-turn-helix domain-containing protein [Vulcanimicrobiota bacterium]